MKKLIKQVIDGEISIVSLPFKSVSDIQKIIQGFGIDTNVKGEFYSDLDEYEIFYNYYPKCYALSIDLYHGMVEFRRVEIKEE